MIKICQLWVKMFRRMAHFIVCTFGKKMNNNLSKTNNTNISTSKKVSNTKQRGTVVFMRTGPFQRNSAEIQQLSQTPRLESKVKVIIECQRGLTTDKGLFVFLLPLAKKKKSCCAAVKIFSLFPSLAYTVTDTTYRCKAESNFALQKVTGVITVV